MDLDEQLDRAAELGVEAEAAAHLAAYLDGVEEALESYEGNREELPTELLVVDVPVVPSVMWALGTLHRVEYDRLEDGTPTRRFHDFEDEKPVLAVDEDENLWIVGGDYRVTDAGIVG